MRSIFKSLSCYALLRLATYHFPCRRNNIPHPTDILPGRLPRLHIIHPIIQRHLVVRHNHRTIRQIRRTQQSSIHTIPKPRVIHSQERRPVFQAVHRNNSTYSARPSYTYTASYPYRPPGSSPATNQSPPGS